MTKLSRKLCMSKRFGNAVHQTHQNGRRHHGQRNLTEGLKLGTALHLGHLIEGGRDGTFIGTGNFEWVMGVNADFNRMLSEAFTNMAKEVPFQIFLALFIAMLLNGEYKGRGFFRAVFVIPIILATGVATLSFFILTPPLLYYIAESRHSHSVDLFLKVTVVKVYFDPVGVCHHTKLVVAFIQLMIHNIRALYHVVELAVLLIVSADPVFPVTVVNCKIALLLGSGQIGTVLVNEGDPATCLHSSGPIMTALMYRLPQAGP